jgi:DNA-directed RNA polymerase specialized sigma24 family protein
MPAPHHRRQTVFGKNLRRRNPATAASDIAALFSRYDRKLRDRVSAVVNTSQANIEDACMFAWVQLLRCELDEVDAAYSWLTTVAIREAIKLDRADRRTRPLPVDEHGAVIEPIDPRDELPRQTYSTTPPPSSNRPR